jgi:hypothetical protein
MGRGGLPTGKSAISALLSTSNYGGRRYGAAAGQGIDPRDMWKDPSTLRQNEEQKFAEEMRAFGTKKRMEDDTEVFETEVDEQAEQERLIEEI